MRNHRVAHNGGVPDVERQIDLPAPPDQVWEMLTDPDSLGEWFGAEIDGGLTPGEVTRFTWPDGNSRRALVETVVAPKRLTFRWLPDEDQSGSRVEIDVEETTDGTRMRILETM